MTVAIDQLFNEVESADGLDRMLPLEEIIEDAQKNGNLRELPRSEAAFRENSNLIVRLKKRLFHLGYLEKARETDQLSKDDLTAIQAFQEEAAITVDGWVGRETWQVMEDLFSFEADSHMERWTSDVRYLALLKRAIQLRLFAFGLEKTPPSQCLKDPLSGLEGFVNLANAIQLTEEPVVADYSYETLALLFDQDKITECLANYLAPPNRKLDPALKSFVVCNAKIELWLLGYPIVPDGNGRYREPARRRHRTKRPQRPNRYGTFYTVLRQFCADVNPGRTRKLRARNFESQCAAFLSEFAASHDNSPQNRGAFNETFLVETIRQHPEAAQKEWENQRSFAGRLWDGVRRAWGWIKRLFRKAVRVVTSLVRNVVRVVWSLAIHSVAMVRAAIRSFPESVGFFLRSEVKGSDSKAVAYSHDKDFDWRVYVAPEPDRQSAEVAINSLREQVTRFRFSLRLVGLLIKSLFKTIRFLPSGYLAVFLAIARIRPALDEFVNYFEANKTLLLQ